MAKQIKMMDETRRVKSKGGEVVNTYGKTPAGSLQTGGFQGSDAYNARRNAFQQMVSKEFGNTSSPSSPSTPTTRTVRPVYQPFNPINPNTGDDIVNSLYNLANQGIAMKQGKMQSVPMSNLHNVAGFPNTLRNEQIKAYKQAQRQPMEDAARAYLENKRITESLNKKAEAQPGRLSENSPLGWAAKKLGIDTNKNHQSVGDWMHEYMNDPSLNKTYDAETVKEYNRIYDTEGAGAAQQYVMSKSNTEYPGMERIDAFLLGAGNGSGINSLLGGPFGKEKYLKTVEEQQRLSEKYPYASTAGNITGTVGLMTGISSLIGGGAAAIAGGEQALNALPIGGRVALRLGSSALTYAASTAAQNAAAASHGLISSDKYVKDILKSGGTGAASGLAHLATIAGIEKILSKAGVGGQYVFADFLKNLAGSTAAAGTRVGIDYAAEDKNPTAEFIQGYMQSNPSATEEEIRAAYGDMLKKRAAEQFAVSFIFSLIDSYKNTMDATEAGHVGLGREYDRFSSEMEALYRNPPSNAEEAAAWERSLHEKVGAFRSRITSGYYGGQQDKIDSILSMLDELDARAAKWGEGLNTSAAGTSGATAGSATGTPGTTAGPATETGSGASPSTDLVVFIDRAMREGAAGAAAGAESPVLATGAMAYNIPEATPIVGAQAFQNVANAPMIANNVPKETSGQIPEFAEDATIPQEIPGNPYAPRTVDEQLTDVARRFQIEQAQNESPAIMEQQETPGNQQLVDIAKGMLQEQEAQKDAQRQAIVDAGRNLDSDNLASVMNGATMLTEAEKQAAYREGMGVAVQSMKAEAQNVTGQEGYDLSGAGSGRSVSFSQGRQTGGVQSAAGVPAESSWRAGKDAADPESESIRFTEEISATSIFPEAEKGQVIHLVSGGASKAVNNSLAMAKAAGIDRVNLFGSDTPIKTTGGKSVRASINLATKEMNIQVNNPRATSDQLTGHEITEFGVSDGRIVIPDVLKHLKHSLQDNGFDSEVADNIISTVVDPYLEGFNLDDPNIPSKAKLEAVYAANKEMVCDCGGNINQFDGVEGYEGTAALMQFVTDIVRPYINEKMGGVLDAASEASSRFIGTDQMVAISDDEVSVNGIVPAITEMPKSSTEYSSTLYREPAQKELMTLDKEGKITIKEKLNMSGRDFLIKQMKEKGYRDKKNTLSWLDKTADFMDKAGAVYKFIGMDDINNVRLVIDPRSGNIVLKALVKNGEYPINVDLTKECTRRIALGNFIKYLSEHEGRHGGKTMLEEVPLTAKNLVRFNQILKDEGFDTACLGCFVETRRYRIQEWADSFIEKYNSTVDRYNPDAGYFDFSDKDTFVSDLSKKDLADLNEALEGYKANQQADKAAKKERLGKSRVSLTSEENIDALVRSGKVYQKKLRVSDLITPKGRTALHRDLPELESLVLGHYGSNTPKSVELFTPYNYELGSILSVGGEPLRDYVYPIGGAREQSFSDSVPTHLMDQMEKTADLAVNKLTDHIYTKVPSEVLLLGLTGRKFNMSIMFNIDADVDNAHAGLRADGSYFVGDRKTSELEAKAGREKTFVQSFPYDQARRIQNTPGYSKHCGMIGVGYSYYHIRKMLDDTDFGQIIGYHPSGMNGELAQMAHIDKATSYEPVQNNLKINGLRHVTGDYYGLPSYASWPQGIKTSDNKMVEKTNIKIKDFDMKGNLKKYGGPKTMKLFLKWLEDNRLTVDTSKGSYKGNEQHGFGDFPLYQDLKKTRNPKKTVDNYITWCLENDMLPEFYEFADHDNYFNLIYDFTTYDHRTLKYSPQVPVTMTFPDNFFKIANHSLNQWNNYMMRQAPKEGPTFEKMYNEAVQHSSELSLSDDAKWDYLDDKSIYFTTRSHLSDKGGDWELYNVGESEYELISPAGESISVNSAQAAVDRYIQDTGDNSINERLDALNEFQRSMADRKKNGWKGPEADKSKDAYGRKLSKKMQSYMKNSKMRTSNGQLLPMFHGTESANFTIFDPSESDDKTSLFFSSSPSVSETYIETEVFGFAPGTPVKDTIAFADQVNNYTEGEWEVSDDGLSITDDNGETHTFETPEDTRDYFIENYGASGVYEVYLNLTNPLVMDAKGAKWNNLPSEYNGKKIDGNDTRAWARFAHDNGYDGMIFHNIVDNGMGGFDDYNESTVAVAFNSNQVKSVNNQNPTENEDFRFSSQLKLDGKNVELTEREEKLVEQLNEGYLRQIEKLQAEKEEEIAKLKEERDARIAALREQKNERIEYEEKAHKVDVNWQIAAAKENVEKAVQAEREIAKEKIAKVRQQKNDRIAYLEKSYRQNLDRQITKWKDKMEKAVGAEKETAKVRLEILREQKNARINDILRYYRQQKQNQRDKRADRKLRVALQKKALKALRESKNKPGLAAQRVQELLKDIDLKALGMTDGTRISLHNKLLEIMEMRKTDPNYLALHAEKDWEKVERLFKKQINDMSLEEVSSLIMELSALIHYQQNTDKILRGKQNRSAAGMGRQIVRELKQLDPLDITNPVKRLTEKYVRDNLSPARVFRRISGYQHDSALDELWSEIPDGYTKVEEFRQKSDALFDDFRKDKKNKDFIKNGSKQTIQVTDGYGRTAMISPGMRVSLFMASKNRSNLEHIAVEGITVPDPKLYEKGLISDAYGRGKTLVLQPTEVTEIVSHMTESEMEFAKLLEKFFDEYAKEAINETSVELDGILKATVDNYFPITSDKNYLAKAMDTFGDPTLEGWGSLKARQEGADNKILLEDARQVLKRHIRNTARYYGLAVPIRDFNKVFNYSSRRDDVGDRSTVRKAISMAWDEDTKNYIDTLISKDINAGGRDAERGFLDDLRSMYAGSTLNINLGVAAKQVTSYLMAGSILDSGSLVYGLSHGFTKEDQKYMDSITPWGWTRRQGESTIELGDIARKRDPISNYIPNLNQMTDVWTTNRLFLATEHAVQQEYPDLKRGDKEYDEALAKKYNDVLWRTQPQYGVAFRPEYLRKTDIGSRTFGMFKTESMQMSGELIDSWGQWKADEKRAKKYKGNADYEKYKKESAKQFYKTFCAWAASNMLFSVMGTALNLLLFHKGHMYRNEKGEVDWETLATKTAMNFAGSAAGGFFYASTAFDIGSYLYNALAGNKATWYDIEAPGFSLINDAVNNMGNFVGTMNNEDANTKAKVQAATKLALSISKFTSVGFANNLLNLMNSLILYKQDYDEGTLGRFEAGKGILKDTSPTKDQYANMAIDAARTGDMSRLKRALKNTKQENLEKALGRKVGAKAFAKFVENPDNFTAYLSATESEDGPKLTDVPDHGYSSFTKLREAIGDPEREQQWHHIVEQEQGPGDKNFGTFKATQIHNTNNIVSMPSGTKSPHSAITQYYGTVQDFTDGKTVREWLSTKSFEEQFDFGMEQLRKYGDVTPTENGWVFIPNKEKIEKELPMSKGNAGEKTETQRKWESGLAEAREDGSVSGKDARDLALKMMSEGLSADEAKELYMSNQKKDSKAANWKGEFEDYLNGRNFMEDAAKIKDKKLKADVVNGYLDDHLSGYDGYELDELALWMIAGYGESTYPKRHNK